MYSNEQTIEPLERTNVRTTSTPQPIRYKSPECSIGGTFKGLVAAVLMLAAGLILTGNTANAANLLQNGDFNGPLAGTWNVWTYGGGWAGQTTTPADLYDGTPCVYMGGSDGQGGGVNQVLFAQPGIPYTFSCASAVNAWWWPEAQMRLIFLDASQTQLLLAITNCAAGITGYDTGLPWSNYTFTVTSPSNTVQVKAEFACYGHGTVRFDNAVLTAPLVYPTIDNVYPDGTSLMQATNAFVFTAASTATPINDSGIQVTVNGVDVSTDLVIAGTSLSKNVLYSGIRSNRTYSVNIQVSDANGLIVTRSLTFDTFSPTYYTWEAEDWDFNGGHFIDNPQTDAYLGLTNSLPETDYHETSTGTNAASWAYRPWVDVPVPQTEVTADVKRAQYANTNDYDVGWYDSGEWLNYTRTFPSGLYNVYARMSSPGSSTLNLSQVTSGQGTTNQTTVSLGNFAQQNGLGWSSYSWVPLTDASGNLVKLNLGGVSTLRATAGGNANFQFLMLVPADTNAPTVTGLYPDGSTQFQATNTLTFTAGSIAGINTNSIQVTLNVTNVAVHFTTNLTSANGLTVGGTPNSRTVTYTGLLPNAVYNAVIAVTDLNNNTLTIRPRFDTYSPVLTWEGEDWDYNYGQFISSPAVDAYANLQGQEGVDYHFTNTAGARPYRPLDGPAAGVIQDTPRAQYLAANTNDYAVGYFTRSEWLNYTRNFPSGTYNVYGRFSAGGGTSYLSLGLVTNGWTTPGQDTQPLGTFTVADTTGWGTYRFTPLRDPFGNLAQVTLNGQATLKVQRTTGADANINFFMLLPAETSLPTITQVTPSGWMQSTNQLRFVASSTAGIATSNIVVRLNGVTVSNLGFTGSSTTWNVSCNLAPNATYTAVITVTDNNSQMAATTVSFDTMSPGSFTWEAEDYDFGGGQFYDNPQVNLYLGTGGNADVDFHKAGTGGSPLYRTDVVATEVCGDTVRPQYAGTGYTDYDVGYTSTGDWWNYTRTYPQGKFNIYFRAARGSAGTATMGLQQVTSGGGTSNQTTVSLGSFAIPATGGWQNYAWVPLMDSTGKPAVVSLGGTNTLRLTDGGANLNFLLLAPALVLNASTAGGSINLSFGTQPGFNYSLLYTENLGGGAWTELSTVPGDGSVKTFSSSMAGPGRFYRLLVH